VTGEGEPRASPHVLVRNNLRATAFAVLLSLGAAAICILVAIPSTRTVVEQFDEAVLRFLLRFRWEPFTAVALALNVLGGTVVTLPVRVVAAVYLAVKRRWWLCATFVAAIAVSEVLTTVLKRSYERPRPPGSLVGTSGFSFPSGHAVATAVTAVLLVIVLIPSEPQRLRWLIYAIALALLMGLSRAYLGAHWLSDAVAGVLMGGAVAFAIAVIGQGIRDATRSRFRRMA
jgi:membrane-associated phospholipid phosphatase